MLVPRPYQLEELLWAVKTLSVVNLLWAVKTLIDVKTKSCDDNYAEGASWPFKL